MSLTSLLSAAAQMVVTDLSAPERRADALSKLGLCFGIGMIAGSTLGGHLSTRFGWVSLYTEKVDPFTPTLGHNFRQQLLLVEHSGCSHPLLKISTFLKHFQSKQSQLAQTLVQVHGGSDIGALRPVVMCWAFFVLVATPAVILDQL